jgi:hypothetical protein
MLLSTAPLRAVACTLEAGEADPRKGGGRQREGPAAARLKEEGGRDRRRWW